jgi:hypothetical protein
MLAGLVAAAGPAHALSIDARDPAAAELGRRVAGRVTTTASARGADGVLRTTVTLDDGSGRPVATFHVPGGREGPVMWVADGVPLFEVGERVEVALVDGAGGPRLADDPEALARLSPAPSGLSGERWNLDGIGAGDQVGAAPTVTDLSPLLAGAAPGSPTEVTIQGTGFGAVQGMSRVTFQGLFERVDAPVVEWTDTVIRCRIPVPGLRGTPQVLSGPIKVWTPEGGWSDGSEFVGGPRFRITYQWAGDAYPDARLPIAVHLNPQGFPGGAAAGEMIREMLAAWDTPSSYAHMVYRGLTNADGGNHGADLTRRDGRNTVCWRTEWPHNPSWIAVTWSAIDTLTFERLETDLEMNGEKMWTLDPENEPDAFDLPSTLVHEFGHWLRLGHTQNVASVMNGFTIPGVRRRQISPADRFGASYVYPSYGVIEAPAQAAAGAPIALRVQALDREGNPLASLATSKMVVHAVPLDGGDMVSASGLAGATDQEGWTNATLPALADGRYRIEAAIEDRVVRPSPVVTVGAPAVPAGPAFAFSGVSPQPLRAGVRGAVRFALPASSHVRLDLYDARGRLVRELANERFAPGPHELAVWTTDAAGHTLTSGVYFLRMASLAGASFEPQTSRVVVLP